MTIKNKSLLLIEDDPLSADIYQTKFTGSGFEVKAVFDTEEAVGEIKKMQKGEKEVADFVLMEFSLISANGLNLVKLIRNHEKTKNIPLIILTGWTNEDLIEKGVDIKAEKYLLKSLYTPDNLVEMMRAILKEK